MALVHIYPNRTHPYNNPASPQYRKNMIYALGDVGIGNGMSWSYFNPGRVFGNNLGVSALGGENPWSRPYGEVISMGAYKTEFNEEDVKKWNPQLKANLAYLVDKGYITVDIDSIGLGVTGNQIRTFV